MFIMPEARRGFSGDTAAFIAQRRIQTGISFPRFLGPETLGFHTFTPPDVRQTSFRTLGGYRQLYSHTARFQRLPRHSASDAQTTGAPLDTAIARNLPKPDIIKHPPPPEEHIIITASRGDEQKSERPEDQDRGNGTEFTGNNAGVPPKDPPRRHTAFSDPDDGKGDKQAGATFREERRLLKELLKRQSERTLENQGYRNYLINFASHNGITVEFTDNGASFVEENTHATLQIDPAQGSEGIRTAITQITHNTFGEEREIDVDGFEGAQLHRELEMAILKNGAHTLIRKLGSNGWHEEARTALGLPEDEQRSVREIFDDSIRLLRNIRENQTPDVVQAAELDYIAQVQRFVRRLPGTEADESGVNPARVRQEQNRTCAEASVIAGALLEEAGIQYAGGRFPGHSFLVVRTTGGRVYHRDFIHPQADYELLNSYLQGDTDTSESITVLDISSFIASQNRSQLRVNLTRTRFEDSHPRAYHGDPRHFMTIYPAETSHIDEILESMSSSFDSLDMPLELSFAADLGIHLLPAEPNYYLRQANALSSFGGLEEAHTLATRAIELDTNYSSGYIIRAGIEAEAGDYSGAEADYAKGIALDKSNPAARIQAAKFFSELGRLAEAESQCQIAVIINPDQYGNRQMLAGIQKRLGKFDEAVQNLDIIVASFPEARLARIMRGLIFLEVGDSDRALTDFEADNRLAPQDPYIISNRGVAHVQLEHFDEALSDLTSSLEQQPTNPYLIANMANYYHATGDYDAEVSSLQNAITLTNPLQQDNLLKLYWRLAFASLHTDHDVAFQAASQAIRMPQNVHQDNWFFGAFSLEYAQIAKSYGASDEMNMTIRQAQHFYDDLREESPDNPTGYYGHALALALIGRIDEAEIIRAIADEKLLALPPLRASAKRLEVKKIHDDLDQLIT
jgi:tetratricopeptide (TPR) repeat protein